MNPGRNPGIRESARIRESANNFVVWPSLRQPLDVGPIDKPVSETGRQAQLACGLLFVG
jgi:hypothetical protein